MTDKYYTPELEEFYIGFQYEMLCRGGDPSNEDDWNKFNFGTDNDSYDFDFDGTEMDEAINYFIESNKARVKYLDREDIESLGFVQITDDCFNLYIREFRGREDQEIRILIRETTLIYLALDSRYDKEENKVLFSGNIKNKSELKRILKQIGYEKAERHDP